MKRFLFDTWYGALVLWCGTSGVFLAFLAFDVFLPDRLPRPLVVCLGKTLFVLAFLSGIIFFVAWVVSLARRHWKRAMLQAFLGLGLLLSVLGALCAVLIAADLGLLANSSKPMGNLKSVHGIQLPPSATHFQTYGNPLFIR